MTLLYQGYLRSTVELGVKNGREVHWIGTGLLFADNVQENENVDVVGPSVLTCRHVIERIAELTTALAVRFIRISDGKADLFEVPLEQDSTRFWKAHPNKLEVDSAAIRLTLKSEQVADFDIHLIHRSQMWTLAEMKANGCTEGDGIFHVGYPYSLEQISERSRMYPLVRSGIIARIQDAYDGESSEYLIDATVYPGNSGGPVIIRPELSSIEQGPIPTHSKIIGFVSEYLDYKDIALSERDERPRAYFFENSGLSLVETVDSVLQVLELLRKELDADDERFRISIERST